VTETGETQVNVDALRALYREDEVATNAFEHFAGRQRSQKETKVDRLEALLSQKGFNVQRRDLVAFFRSLEAMGCGKFITGRLGHPSRFRWDVEMIGVSLAAKGEEQPIESMPFLARDEEDDDVPGSLAHQFVLRRDFTVRFSVPADITGNEAGRLADFIKTLPFEEMPRKEEE